MWVYIVLFILIILVLLLNLYTVIHVSYTDEKLEYHVKYSFIKIYSNVQDKKKIRKSKKKSSVSDSKVKKQKKISSDKKSSSDNTKKDSVKKEDIDSSKEKQRGKLDDLIEKIQMVVDFISSSEKNIYRVIKKISVYDLDVDFVVADNDAYECAMRFGLISAAMYNIIGYLSASFRTRIKKLNISSKYNNNNSVYNFSFIVRLKLGTGIATVIGILFKYFFGSKKDDSVTVSSPDEKNQLNILKECLKMSEHPVNGLMGTTIEKLREMIDVNTIIGDPISTPEGSTIIPVSKVSFGFASGGSDLPTKQQKQLFGGAAGAGMSIQPLAFICVSPSGEAKLLQMSVNATKENAIINTIPDLIDKISDMVSSKDKKKTEKEKNQDTK